MITFGVISCRVDSHMSILRGSGHAFSSALLFHFSLLVGIFTVHRVDLPSAASSFCGFFWVNFLEFAGDFLVTAW